MDRAQDRRYQPQGRGFLTLQVRTGGTAGGGPGLVVVENWFADLKGKLGK